MIRVLKSKHSADNIFRQELHQIEGSKKILDYKKNGRPGFLLGDGTGVGKTWTTWQAILAMPETKILVVCILGAIPNWERTITQSGVHNKTVTLISYGSLRHLLNNPIIPNIKTKKVIKSSKKVHADNRKKAKSGKIKDSWPIIIFDDAHHCGNRSSQRSMICSRLAEQAQFSLWLTATAADTPLKIDYLTPLMTPEFSGQSSANVFRYFLRKSGIEFPSGKIKNWKWLPKNEAEKIEQLSAISHQLYTKSNPLGIRRLPEDVANWPKVSRFPAPTYLTAGNKKLYEAEWISFRKNLHEIQNNPDAHISKIKMDTQGAFMRFRQKASLIRSEGTADFAQMMHENGEAIAISCFFLETTEAIAKALQKKRLKTGIIWGRHKPQDNEVNRLAFQKGELDALVFTVSDAISLHSGEYITDQRSRCLIVHDLRPSGIQVTQIEGRTNRDGKASSAYYTYAEKTVEEEMVLKTIEKMKVMATLSGDDSTPLKIMLETLQNIAA